MSLSVSCTSCGKLYQKLKTELRGKKVRCTCGNKMVVPLEDPDDWLSHPLPEAQQVPLQPSYLPPPPIPQPAQKSAKVKKRRKSDKGDFRPIDFLFMISGGIVFAFGLFAILGIIGSLAGIPAIIALSQTAPGGASDFLPMTMVYMTIGLVDSLFSIMLGFCGGAMGYYVYEKRVSGKSEYSWAFGYSAVAAVLNLLVALLWATLLMATVSKYNASLGISYASIALSPLPITVLVLYAIRRQLGFRELESNQQSAKQKSQ